MIVIKLGGHAMGQSQNQENPFQLLASRWEAGERFAIIHGGGPMIDTELKRKNIESTFSNGYRVTTPQVMEVVEMVLTGSVLRSVVRSLNQVGLPAVGITGSDGGLLSVREKDGGAYGLVGEVVSVNPSIIETLIGSGYLPVISPTANDGDGRALNINGDIAAGAIAGALKADQMIFMTDVPGIYGNWPDKNSLLNEVSVSQLRSMDFADGMIPKVSAVINAVSSGARSARIIDGKSIAAFADALVGKGGTWVKP